MRVNYTDKMLYDIQSKPVAKDKYTTDISGMTVTLRGCADRTSIFFYFKTEAKGAPFTSVQLGTFPLIKIDEARMEYLKYKKACEAGQSLSELKVKEEKGKTFGELWDAWREIEDVSLEPKTIKKYQSLYRTHLSKIADVLLSQINPNFVAKFFQPYIDNKEYSNVKRIASPMRAAMDYAMYRQWIEYNPIMNISKYLPKVEYKHLPTFNDETLREDMVGLFKAFRKQRGVIQALLQMYFYTLLRSLELRSLTVDQVQGNYFYTKTKTLKEFKVPLTLQAQRIIQWQLGHRQGYSKYVFESISSATGIISDYTINKILKAKGFYNKITVHGIRSCGRMWMTAQPDLKETIIEMCLSHVKGDRTEQAYNRGQYYDQRCEAMQRWGDFVEECVKQAGADDYLMS